MYSKLHAPTVTQFAIGVERQLPRNTTVAVTYTRTRGTHLLQTVNINAPLPGTDLRPYGNAGNLFLYESGGLMRQQILMANFNTRFSRGVSLFGNYSLNYAKDLPARPRTRTISRRIGAAPLSTGAIAFNWSVQLPRRGASASARLSRCNRARPTTC